MIAVCCGSYIAFYPVFSVGTLTAFGHLFYLIRACCRCVCMCCDVPGIRFNSGCSIMSVALHP